MGPSLSVRHFGHLPTGETVEAWTLRGSDGLTLEVITYGGIVSRLLMPESSGRVDDLVLGFNDLAPYLARHPYFGAIAGRVAGRLTGASFKLDGQTYSLAANNEPNHLHGGIQGFDKKLWSAVPVTAVAGAPSLRLSYCSPHGEEGYPGTVQVSVTYTITADNIFLIETEAETDRPTPFNLTHHSYFNLGGESFGSISDHELQIYADEVVANDEHMTLLGRLDPVAGTANDLRQPLSLCKVIPSIFKNHGALYRLRRGLADNTTSSLVLAARLRHPASGRVLEVSTTDSYLQLYTGSSLDGSLTGKSGLPYRRHAGICLECEGYPDGVNAPSLGDTVLRPGFAHRSTTAYAFSSEPLEAAADAPEIDL